MKKKLLILIVLSFTIMINAKETHLKSILTANEWQLNSSKTFLLNEASLKENKINLDEIFSKLFDVKYCFDSDNDLKIKLLDVSLYEGKYTINKNQLVFINNIKNDKQTFNIISFNQNEIIIYDKKNNLNLVLRSMNSVSDLKSILIAKDWKLDIEAMKLGLMLKMAAIPEMKELSKEEKDIAVKSTFKAMEGIRYKFYENDSVEYKILLKEETHYETKGTFSIDSEKNELIINTEDEPNKRYQIIEVNSNKLVLKAISNNLDFVFIPVN